MPRRRAPALQSASANLPIAVRRFARRGAPRAPTRAGLERLFERAWRAAPPNRRPDPRGGLRLAADVTFMSDAAIAEFNAQHLGHDGPTDVLSFPMLEFDPEREAFFLGEILASFETAAREARARGLPLEEELARYAVHGFLHLLGYADDTPSRRAAMARVQEAVLAECFEKNAQALDCGLVHSPVQGRAARCRFPITSAWSRRAETAAPGLSIVIPAFNEARRILPYLRAIDAWCDRAGEPCETLVVDDGSSDATAAVVREEMRGAPRLGLLRYEANRGKGHAVRVGMRAARGALRLFADADGSTPIAELDRLRDRLREAGADVAVGSRALPAPGIERKIKPHRYVIGQVFRHLRGLLLNVKVVDSQCGFKLFSAAAAECLFGAARVDGFAFDVELLYLAARWDLKVVEVPVNWRDDQASRVNLLTDPFRMLGDMWRVRTMHRHTARPEAGEGERGARRGT
ncbi:MAG: rRNA maturation RNase YbeY [Planctomycetota bacterium]|nr:rRNA maturation RNase YbeY [Planctomycetota bacterium]